MCFRYRGMLEHYSRLLWHGDRQSLSVHVTMEQIHDVSLFRLVLFRLLAGLDTFDANEKLRCFFFWQYLHGVFGFGDSSRLL